MLEVARLSSRLLSSGMRKCLRGGGDGESCLLHFLGGADSMPYSPRGGGPYWKVRCVPPNPCEGTALGCRSLVGGTRLVAAAHLVLDNRPVTGIPPEGGASSTRRSQRESSGTRRSPFRTASAIRRHPFLSETAQGRHISRGLDSVALHFRSLQS